MWRYSFRSVAQSEAKRGHPAFSGLSRLRSGRGREKSEEGGTIAFRARAQDRRWQLARMVCGMTCQIPTIVRWPILLALLCGCGAPPPPTIGQNGDTHLDSVDWDACGVAPRGYHRRQRGRPTGRKLGVPIQSHPGQIGSVAHDLKSRRRLQFRLANQTRHARPLLPPRNSRRDTGPTRRISFRRRCSSRRDAYLGQRLTMFHEAKKPIGRTLCRLPITVGQNGDTQLSPPSSLRIVSPPIWAWKGEIGRWRDDRLSSRYQGPPW